MSGIGHGFIGSVDRNFVPFTEESHIMIEIGQKDVFAKIFQFSACVPWKPVLNDFFFIIHKGIFVKKIRVELPKLHFPEYKFKLRADNSGGQSLKIFDIVRGKYVRLTPEEWVRQHVLHFLIHDRNYPRSLIGVEKRVVVNRLERRVDILVYNSVLEPFILVECKSPQIKVTQEVFDQAARYNLTVNVPYFVLSNGLDTFCCTLDHNLKSYKFLEEVPFYEKM